MQVSATPTNRVKPTRQWTALKQALLLACFVFYGAWVVAIWLTPYSGYDWEHSFQPAARHALAPYNYAEWLYHNPPWGVLLWWPWAWLPLAWGELVNNLAGVVLVVVLVRRWGGHWAAVFAVLLSPPMYHLLYNSNIDWAVLPGLILGGGWSVPLLAIKPQVAALAAVVFWQRARWRWQFWIPTAVVGVGSLLVWGLWPLAIETDPAIGVVNESIFPWGVPIGLLAVVLMLRYKSVRWAVTATIMLMPYWRVSSLLALVAVWAVKYPRVALVLVALFWGLSAGLVVMFR